MKRDLLIQEVVTLNQAIAERTNALLEGKQVDLRDLLTETDFRAFAATTSAAPNVITRTWMLLRGRLSEHLNSIHPDLDFRYSHGGIHRGRLINAKDRLRARVVTGYGKSHESIVFAWIEHLKNSSSGEANQA